MAVRDLSQELSFRGEDVDVTTPILNPLLECYHDRDLDSEDGTDNESGL